MKNLKDFAPLEKEWFLNDFSKGRRHMSEGEYSDYYYVFSTFQIQSPTGSQRANAFSYTVTSNGNDMFGVMPDEQEIGTGWVSNPEEPKKITFLNDSGIDDLSEIFGKGALAICVMSHNDTVDAILLQDGDINLHGVADLPTAHRHIFEEGIRNLYGRLNND